MKKNTSFKVKRIQDLFKEGWDKSKIISSFTSINEEVWNDLVPEDAIWTPEIVEKQIKNCPHLQYCAINNKDEIVATLNMIYAHEKDALNCRSWKEISGDRTLSTHQNDGDCVFGIDLTVSKNAQGNGIADSIMQKAFLVSVILANKKGAFLGSRIPGYHKRKGMSVEDYVWGKRRNGKTIDPELRLYQKEGFKIIKIIPNYIEDPESLNYGVLMFWENPFYKFTKFFPLQYSTPIAAKFLL